MHSKRKRRTVLVALLAFVLATSAYAFTAANTFPDEAGRAGDGSGDISGYEVTNVSYDLNNTNPSTLDSVSFDLDAEANEVQARVNGGSWVVCAGGPTSWTCDITGTSTLGANTLQVAAAS